MKRDADRTWPTVQLTAARQRMAGEHGPRFWRSLEELAGSEAFQDYLKREFPDQADQWHDESSRRSFLRLMAASLALAGVSGCAFQPPEKVVPYVRMPEEFARAKPVYFASALTLGGYAIGILAESNMGRPTKIEGNPDHPASLGGTDAFAQAEVLSLYDPDRSQVVTNVGQISTWEVFLSALDTALVPKRSNQGAGLRILTETVTSPTLTHQIEQLLKKYPKAQWHQYEPVNNDAARAGARLAFDTDVETIYDFEPARTIVSLDADFLSVGPGRLRSARHFTAHRDVRRGHTEMNRLYVVESTPTITGAMADHRLPLRSGDVEPFAFALARELGVAAGPAGENQPSAEQTRWITAVARDLKSHQGASLVIAGIGQPPVVHALAHMMNQQLGNVGKTVRYIEPVAAGSANQTESLRSLVNDMQAGSVDFLLIMDGNPVYTSPADLNFHEAVRKVKLRVRLGLYEDETSALCHWHIPQAHALECWSDARAFDGTITISQPLIAPLYGGKSTHELVSALQGDTDRSNHEIVRDYWRKERMTENFDRSWRTALNQGYVDHSAGESKSVTLRTDLAERLTAQAQQRPTSGPKATAANLEIVFRPDPSVWDGRYANNGWLQELPRPLTKITWDNPALVSKATADRLGVANGDVIELEYHAVSVRAPVWVTPGHVDDSVTVFLGYGRTRTGRVGTGVGFDVYPLRRAEAPWFGTGLAVRKLNARHELATTQHAQIMEGREVVQVGTLSDFRADPGFLRKHEHEDKEPPPGETLYPPEHRYDGHAWGMVINLETCIGCNACMVACQAENNIPVVGKEQVLVNRHMHWLRVDRYYSSTDDEQPAQNPATYFQPVPCMHCENAPCELVCPVAATVHDHEGINDMVYNRCVGTRYCSNNCPYKVRRFNFLQYSDQTTPSLKLLNNPDVTVRSRGVMEKCTYCIQRVNAARYEAELGDRSIRDGELQTACQQACPTRAIVFGDIHNRESAVARMRTEPHHYSLLAELNTRPRTTYLAKITNPNPDLAEPPHGA